MSTTELLKEYKSLPRDYQRQLEEYAFYLKFKAAAKKTKKTEVKTVKKTRVLGAGEGKGYWISPDFDEPLEEMKEYMY